MQPQGIGLVGLIALVISSAIGSGVFALSTDISAAAAPGPAILAWLIAGVGFVCLATSFGKLSLARPDLNGLAAYAREGFGPFAGFISGWGYWLSIWVGCVAFGVMLITALDYFVPGLEDSSFPFPIIIMSLVTWFIILVVNRGVEQAAILNAVVMACKLVPILSFIAVMAILFRPELFTLDFWGTLANNLGGPNAPGALPTQMVNCLMVMMWVFVGMEGATVLGRRARNKRDVSRATVLGGIALVAIYSAASILPYGFLTREELIAIDSPSMAYIFKEAVGPWGGAFIAGGLVVSIFGAWLSYTILASETLNEMASMKLLPAPFARLNKHRAPTFCLIITGMMVQALSLVTIFSEAAYQFAYSLSTASIIVAWTLAAAYLVQWAWTQGPKRNASAILVGSVACIFLVVAVLIAGPDLLILCSIAYVPGIAFYVIAQHQEGSKRVLTIPEGAVAAVICLIAVAAVICLATGIIVI